jgi:hypothetical protein
MKRIVMLGLALMAACSMAGISAISVSATGAEFVASKTGKTKGKQNNAQVFKTGAGTLECSTVTSIGEITALKSTMHKETLTYSGCVAFGYTEVTVSAAHFEYSANGSARLEETITITPVGAGCSIQIEPQTVEGMTYKNESTGQISAKANVAKIVSKGTGGECGGENRAGTYTGSVEAELEGSSSTVKWVE